MAGRPGKPVRGLQARGSQALWLRPGGCMPEQAGGDRPVITAVSRLSGPDSQPPARGRDRNEAGHARVRKGTYPPKKYRTSWTPHTMCCPRACSDCTIWKLDNGNHMTLQAQPTSGGQCCPPLEIRQRECDTPNQRGALPAVVHQPRCRGFRGRWGGDLVYSSKRAWLSAGHDSGTDMGGVVGRVTFPGLCPSSAPDEY